MTFKKIVVALVSIIIITAVVSGIIFGTIVAWDISISMKKAIARIATGTAVYCLVIYGTTKLVKGALYQGDLTDKAVREKIANELLPNDEILQAALMEVLATMAVKRSKQYAQQKREELKHLMDNPNVTTKKRKE